MVFGSNRENAHGVFIDDAFDLECRRFHLDPHNLPEHFTETLDCGAEKSPQLVLVTVGFYESRGYAPVWDAFVDDASTFLETRYVKVADQDMFQVWKRKEGSDSRSAAPGTRSAGRAGAWARGRARSTTGSARAGAEPISRSSTTSSPPRPAEGTSFCGRFDSSSSAVVSTSSRTGCPAARPPVSSTPSTSTSRDSGASHARNAASSTAWMVRSAPIAASTTAPTRGRGAEPRAGERDRPAVALQPREAPGARSRAARPRRHPERRRPGDLPSAGGARDLAGRKARIIASSWSSNPRKGSETLARLDRHLDRERFELTFVGQTQVGSTTYGWSAPRRPSRSGTCCVRTTSTSLRAVTIRARMPCSKRSPVACLRCFSRAAGTRNSSGDGGLGFRDDEQIPEVLERLVSEIDTRRAAISVPAISDVADKYLEVLGLART